MLPPSRTTRLTLASVLAAAALSARAGPPATPPEAGTAPALPPSSAGAGADRDLPELLGEWIGILDPNRPAGPPGRFHLAPLPFVVANPLLGAGGGLAVVGGFRLGGPETSFSRFEASGFLTTNHQEGLLVRSEVRLPSNEWILSGDWGVGRFPNPAWGLGGDTHLSDRTVVQRRQVQLHETVYRLLTGHLYAGAGWFVDDFFDIVDLRAEAGKATPFSAYPWGTRGRSLSSGLTLNLLWDGRDSLVRPTRGSYLLARFRLEPATLGSDDDWGSFYLDGRTYLAIPGRRDVLALWAFVWSTYGQTPYLLLPQVGADPEHRSGRGMVEGRYAAMDLAYAEVEYRAHLWRALGAVAAVNLVAPSERGPGHGGLDFRTVHGAVAGGLRVLLDRSSGANLVLDVGWEPGGRVGFYLNANETF
jgi:hypothetical protein